MAWRLLVILDSPVNDAEHMAKIIDGTATTVWLADVDVDAIDGYGMIAFTIEREQALAFDTFAEAMECWKRQSTVRPLRDDGRPNRPLTAFTCQPVEDGKEP